MWIHQLLPGVFSRSLGREKTRSGREGGGGGIVHPHHHQSIENNNTSDNYQHHLILRLCITLRVPKPRGRSSDQFRCETNHVQIYLDDKVIDDAIFANLPDHGGAAGGKLISFCNGILCFSDGSTVQISNPSRGEVMRILIVDGGDNLGFGFDSVSKKYKLIQLFHSSYSRGAIILTLGTKSWRKIKSPLHPLLVTTGSPVLCDNTFFWRTLTRNYLDESNEILLFDLHDEKFEVIQLPSECFWRSKEYYLQLLEFRGSLCLAKLESIDLNGNGKVRLYTLLKRKIKNKIQKFWMKETFLLDVPSPSPLLSEARFGGGGDHVLLYWLDWERKRFLFYDLNTKDTKEVNLPAATTFVTGYDVFSYAENFLSLKTFEKGATSLYGPGSTFHHDRLYI